jgi:hypothetical protein
METKQYQLSSSVSNGSLGFSEKYVANAVRRPRLMSVLKLSRDLKPCPEGNVRYWYSFIEKEHPA